MDGSLDANAESIAFAGGALLWMGLEDHYLYLATDAATVHTGQDVFLLLGEEATAQRSAPWAKSGQTLVWDLFLAREESNGWIGWFDADETVLDDADHPKATGSVLEGVVDLALLYGGDWPAEIYAAVGAYASSDGGALSAAIPADDGDGDLAAGEYAMISLLEAPVPEAMPPRPATATPGPRRSTPRSTWGSAA